MSKEELKEDFVEEKNDGGKLVSREKMDDYDDICVITNNTLLDISVTITSSNQTLNRTFTVTGGTTSILFYYIDRNNNSTAVVTSVNNWNITGELTYTWAPAYNTQYNDQESISVNAAEIYSHVGSAGNTLTITSVMQPPPPALYHNESYSVPNMLDPEPLQIYVWVTNVRLINSVLFTDSSSNIITPTESEVISTISADEHIFLYTFTPNASISTLYLTPYNTSAVSNEGLCYENADFTGFLSKRYSNTSMMYGGKAYIGFALTTGTKSFKLTSWMW